MRLSHATSPRLMTFLSFLGLQRLPDDSCTLVYFYWRFSTLGRHGTKGNSEQPLDLDLVHHQYILKFSRFFPTSCEGFRNNAEPLLVTMITELTETLFTALPATIVTFAPTSTFTESAFITATSCPYSAATSYLCGIIPDTCSDLQTDTKNCCS